MMKRLTTLVIPFLLLATLTVAAHAEKPWTTVKGKGIVTMTATGDDPLLDPPAFNDGDVFCDNHFEINCRVNADGSANGTAHFVFGKEFSEAYELEGITLRCNSDTGTVSEDGTVCLKGLSYEKDFAPGVVFTETTGFVIVVGPNGVFTLRWCMLDDFELEIKEGSLTVE